MRILPIAAVLIAALISAVTASAAKVTGTIRDGRFQAKMIELVKE